MSLNFKDNQTDKKALLPKNKANQAKKNSEAEKSVDKIRKKKKKSC